MIIKNGEIIAIDQVWHDNSINGNGRKEAPLSVNGLYLAQTALNDYSGRWVKTTNNVNELIPSYQSMSSIINTNSARWVSTENTVLNNSSRWVSTETIVSSNSANWTSTTEIVAANSSRWNSIIEEFSIKAKQWDQDIARLDKIIEQFASLNLVNN